MNQSIHEQHLTKSVLYAIVASLTYAAMGATIRFVGDRAPTDMVVFFRYVIGFACMVPWFLQNPKRAIFIAKPLQAVGRSIATLLALACVIYAFRFLSVGDVLTLNSTYTLFIPLLLLFVYKIRTPHKMWFGICLGFLGVLLIMNPKFSSFNLASLAGLASGVFGAIALTMIRFMTKTMPVQPIIFYNFWVGTAISGLLLPFFWVSMPLQDIALLLLAGVFGTIFQFCLTLALAKGAVRKISPLMYLSIVFGALADYWIWGTIPSVWIGLGMALVIAGGILTIYFSEK